MNTVYAAFCEATSALLYIGCTENLAMRIRTHGYGGKCFDWMNANGPLEFRALCEKRTKRDALRAEARLIRKLRPPLNSRIVGQRKRNGWNG